MCQPFVHISTIVSDVLCIYIYVFDPFYYICAARANISQTNELSLYGWIQPFSCISRDIRTIVFIDRLDSI